MRFLTELLGKLLHVHDFKWQHLPTLTKYGTQVDRMCRKCTCGKVDNVVQFPRTNPVVAALNDHTRKR